MRLTIFIAVLAAAIAAAVTIIIPRWDEIVADWTSDARGLHALFADEWSARLVTNPLFASGTGTAVGGVAL